MRGAGATIPLMAGAAGTFRRTARRVGAWACAVISAAAGLGTVAIAISWVTTGRVSDLVGLVYPAGSSVALAQFARVLFAGSRRDPLPDTEPGTGEQEPLPAGKVLYREACSDTNPVLVLAAVALLAFGIWVAAGFGSGTWSLPQVVAFILLVSIPACWLLLLVQFVPYGVVITDRYVQIGVRGVPVLGRMWLRAQVPLDAVLLWDVVSSREFRARKAAYRPVRGKPEGAMLGWAMGVRHVLWVHADPERVREDFPDFIMPSTYEFSSASDAGYAQNGLLYINTRRPRSVERALAALLPDRRLPPR